MREPVAVSVPGRCRLLESEVTSGRYRYWRRRPRPPDGSRANLHTKEVAKWGGGTLAAPLTINGRMWHNRKEQTAYCQYDKHNRAASRGPWTAGNLR